MGGIVERDLVGDEHSAKPVLRFVHNLFLRGRVTVVEGPIARERADGPLEPIPKMAKIRGKIRKIRFVGDRDHAVKPRKPFENRCVSTEGQQPDLGVGTKKTECRAEGRGQERVPEIAKRDDQKTSRERMDM